ncbi:unnamed protein product [Caenorhabditis brenneri]
MSNITCATTVELDRLASLNFLISQVVDLIAVFITLGSSVFAIKMIMTKSIFQNSTIILLLLNLFYAVLYQVIYGIEAVIVIYKHFFMQNHPCELLQLESNCAPYLKALLGAASGMILCQTGMILERTFATFLHNYESKKSLIIGSSIAIFIFIVSSQTGRIVYWDDSLSGAVLACFVFPKQTSWRSTKYFFVCTGVTVFNLVISIILKRYNKKLEYQTFEKNKSLIISFIISLFVLALSACTGPFLLSDDPLTGYSFSCVSFPKTSFHKTYPFFITCNVVTLFNLVTTVSIMQYNKKEEYATRFKVGARFRKREAIESTETVCFLALSQFTLMFFYCGSVMIIICIKTYMSIANFSSWSIWVYSVPCIAMMFPLLLIYRIRTTRANRVLIIKSFAESKPTQDDHIKQMKQTWGE